MCQLQLLMVRIRLTKWKEDRKKRIELMRYTMWPMGQPSPKIRRESDAAWRKYELHAEER